jgi:predicted transcriptional regulator
MDVHTVRLDEKTLADLRKIAEKQERPVGWLIRRAVEEFVERETRTRKK